MANRFFLYTLSLSLFIAAWWECGTGALLNIWAKPVAGQVISIELETIQVKAGTRSFYNLTFRYVLNGIEHVGNNFTCCDGLVKRSGVDAEIRKLNSDLGQGKARQVTVWVNPAMPQHAVLSPGVPNVAICVFMFTLFLGYALPKLLLTRLETGAWPEKF